MKYSALAELGDALPSIRIVFFLLLAFSLSFAIACRKRSTAGSGQAVTPLNENATATNSVNQPVDKGDLKLTYTPRNNPSAHTVGSNEQALEKVIANLNEKIALPWDILVSFEDCDLPDAFYDPETHKLTVCYQLIDEYYYLFGHKIKDQTRLDDAVRGAVASTFFHELGHGLVDAWKIPITGKEEDAVDQLSTLILVMHTKNGEQLALDGAVSFMLYADLNKGRDKIFWDTHSLDEQRFYDTICLVYGHYPAKYEFLVREKTLPEERAVVCREDYPRIARSWQQLLSPYIKRPAVG